ncbi:MAG: hypothetical protein PHC41_14175 [Lachnospiraceae bacterium]|nr:hypothetical protein [Lachnospiraceae bacterium]MDD3617352.1 hypothetical protein [Lachnospiraceae bacterium]
MTKQTYITLNIGCKIPQFGLGVYMVPAVETKKNCLPFISLTTMIHILIYLKKEFVVPNIVVSVAEDASLADVGRHKYKGMLLSRKRLT